MNRKKVTVYLLPDVARALKIAAADAGVTQGNVVETVLRDALLDRGGPSMAALEILQTGPGNAADVAGELRDAGETLDAIAADLNRKGYRTVQGKRWNAVSVSRLLRR